MSDLWPCGHARTRDNEQSIGAGGLRCRICRREIVRKSLRRRATGTQRKMEPVVVEEECHDAAKYGSDRLLAAMIAYYRKHHWAT